MICDDRNVDEFEALAEILLSAGTVESSGDSGATCLSATGRSAADARDVAARLRDTAAVMGFYGHDPVLTTLAGLRRQRLELDAAMRRLLAYGREFVRPRPYRLVDLADAAGMSISGVRTAYDGEDVAQVAAATGLAPGWARTGVRRDPCRSCGDAGAG